MYKISLKDVGPDRVTKDVMAHVDLVEEAEIYACSLIEGILNYTNFHTLPINETEYVIEHLDRAVGSFTITRLG